MLFSEAYPECEVENIQLAYDVNKVNELDRDRQVLIKVLLLNYFYRLNIHILFMF